MVNICWIIYFIKHFSFAGKANSGFYYAVHKKPKKNVKRVLWNFPSNMGKNALQLLLYQKIWNCAWTNLPSVHRLKRSRQASENSYFHMSSSQSTRVLDRNACLLPWFLSLFHHNEALVFSSSTLRPASSYPLVDRHGMTCRLAVGKLLNSKTLLLDARSMEICDESSLNKNKWIILLLHTIRAQLEWRRPTQRKIKAYVKTTRNTSVLEWRKNICCQGNEITEWFEVINYSASSGTNGTSEANFHLLSYILHSGHCDWEAI